jgi:hypothetical protein
MLESGVPRETVLDVINIPYKLRSNNISEADRVALVAGFIKGFQIVFYVSASLMALATLIVVGLVRNIPLSSAHTKSVEVDA